MVRRGVLPALPKGRFPAPESGRFRGRQNGLVIPRDGSNVMDVNAKLDKIRHAIGRAQYFSDLGQTGANYTWQLEQAADAFSVLDAHLRAGGPVPDEWNPDSTVGADREAPAPLHRPDGSLPGDQSNEAMVPWWGEDESPARVEEVPATYPVQPLDDDEPAGDRVTCGHCGLSWDDAIITSMTPAPSARCPFEPFHVN